MPAVGSILFCSQDDRVQTNGQLIPIRQQVDEPPYVLFLEDVTILGPRPFPVDQRRPKGGVVIVRRRPRAVLALRLAVDDLKSRPAMDVSHGARVPIAMDTGARERFGVS